MTVAIVSPALVRIGKDFVGLGRLFELSFTLRIAAAIGMVLHRGLAIGALDLIGRRAL